MTNIARRRGFTLVELLVVMGIILVLITIVTLGIRHTSSMAARHQTQATMKLCGDLLAQYKAVNGYKNILGDYNTIQRGLPLRLPSGWITGQFDLPMFVNPRNPFGEEKDSQPQSVLVLNDFKGSTTVSAAIRGQAGDFGDQNDFNDPRWVSNAIRWTQGVMCILLKDPKNRALISNLPPSNILESPPAPKDQNGVINGQRLLFFTIDAAVPLDGWGNPILFVPPGGMHVTLNLGDGKGLQEYCVRSSGVSLDSNRSPLSPNDKPFFASAGPDGFFCDLTPVAKVRIDRSSDNYYSFQDN